MNGKYGVGETVLGNWVLLRLIGEGSFGRVFEAEREDFAKVNDINVGLVNITVTYREPGSYDARYYEISENSRWY